MRDLKSFVDDTSGFCGFMMGGFYNVSPAIFYHFLNIYIRTGVNHLNDYHYLQSLLMDSGFQDSAYSPNFDISKLESILKNHMVIRFFDFNEVQVFKNYISDTIKKREYLNSKEHIRLTASLFTSKPHIRKKVFDRDGRICKHCGATEKLTLDHITPVIKGGANHIDNLQVLCNSCNSKKGGK